MKVARQRSSRLFVRSLLIPELNFGNFIIGGGNQAAHAAALALVDQSKHAPNSLLIYGGVGLGKTHLMHALGHYVQSKFPGTKVLTVHPEQYCRDVIKAHRQSSLLEFRQAYLACDVLIFDDVQLLNGNHRCQQEFGLLLDSLSKARRRVVMTWYGPQQHLTDFEPYVRHSISAGCSVELLPPESSMRHQILLRQAEACGYALTLDVAAYIAEQDVSNIRELEGILRRFLANAAFYNRSANLDLAKEVMREWGARVSS